MLHRNCLLKHVIERKVEGTGRRGRRRKQLLDDLKGNKKILEIERGSTGSCCLENWLRKRLWTSRDYDRNLSVCLALIYI
jgi:hypothetical protein